MAMHAFYPSIWEVEAYRALWNKDQPCLHMENQDIQGYTEKPSL